MQQKTPWMTNAGSRNVRAYTVNFFLDHLHCGNIKALETVKSLAWPKFKKIPIDCSITFLFPLFRPAFLLRLNSR